MCECKPKRKALLLGFQREGEMNAQFLSSPAICSAPPSCRRRPPPSFTPHSSFLPLPAVLWNLRTERRHHGSRSTAVFRPARCSMDVTVGGRGGYDYGNVPKFPRMHVRDPYKRLGLTIDASEEEIREARNFLLEQYAGHESSEESIEAAYEKLLMKSFRERKKTKINLKTRLKKKVEESPPWIQRLLDYVELPAKDVILKRLFLFAFMGGWSIASSAETGPAFQVALSLFSCIYFLNDKMKDLKTSSLIGFGALVVGWIVGSIVVPIIPTTLLQPTWTLELMTSLVSYVFLFLACTFLK